MIQVGEVYYYFGLSCCFIKPIKDTGDRVYCVNCFNLHDAINMPILDPLGYDDYKERGEVTSVWHLSKEHIKKSIFIRYQDMKPDRYRKIGNKIMALPMDESDIRDHKIELLCQ